MGNRPVIDRIETFLGDQLAVVRVRTNDGAEGIGQTSPFRADLTVRVLHEMVAPFFLGRDPWDLEALVDRCVREQYKFPSTFLLRGLCGVDTALWDLLGRLTGQPVVKLLGGQVRDSVPMYASSMSRSISPEAEAERLQRLAADHGFRAAKVRIGQVMGRDSDASPGRTSRLIPHVREVMGPDFTLLADANGAYSAARAIEIGRSLEENGYLHFEEPCPYEDLESTAKVTAALDMQVAGGEQDNTPVRFRRMIEQGVVDVVQPDVGYLGGLARSRRVARMAEDAGIPCTPHCSNRSMLQVFTVHLVAAMPACSQFHEWGIEDTPWTEGIYEPELEVIDGEVAVPKGPGLGIELTDRFLRSARHEVSRR